MGIWIAVLASYLIGSIPTGYLISGWVAGIDIRQHGSGNVGATNVFRTIGKTWGSVALFVDIFKGFVVSYILGRLTYENGFFSSITPYQIVLGIAAVCGHTWPVWLCFKGGKGVATSCGVFLGIFPKAVLGALVVWLITAVLTRYVSLSSMSAAASVLVWILILYHDSKSLPFDIAISALVFVFIVYTHRSNIKRLLSGTENKIGSSRK